MGGLKNKMISDHLTCGVTPAALTRFCVFYVRMNHCEAHTSKALRFYTTLIGWQFILSNFPDK